VNSMNTFVKTHCSPLRKLDVLAYRAKIAFSRIRSMRKIKTCSMINIGQGKKEDTI